MTTFRRLGLLVLFAALVAASTGCHRSMCRDNDSRYRDKECRD